MDVSFIIVNYNSTTYTHACIKSIYRYTQALQFEVLVVDNASPDRSIETLQPVFPEVQWVFSEENNGFGAANNKAIEKAKGEFVFLLNPDTELVSDAAAAFVTFMRQPENTSVAVCGGGTYIPEQAKPPRHMVIFLLCCKAYHPVGCIFCIPNIIGKSWIQELRIRTGSPGKWILFRGRTCLSGNRY